ncbi:MAG: hypothetical protein AAF670_11815 [Planctomycetota bacterium]
MRWPIAITLVSVLSTLNAQAIRAEIVLTSNFGSTFFRLNESSATADEIPRQFLTPFFSSTDFRSPAQLFGLQGFTLYQVDFDFDDASYTFEERRTLSSGTDSLAFSPSGDLFVYNNSGRIGHVDIESGVETLVPLAEVDGNRVVFQGIDFSPTGELFGVDSRALYRIDPSTGAVTRITPSGVDAISSTIFTEFDYSHDGVLRAITFSDTVWQIDPVSGLGENPVSYVGSVFSSIATTAIPEPSAFLALSCGCIGMHFRRTGRTQRR